MSSLPTSAYLSTTPSDKFHRHRRSAAISGDFDNYGLGLFSPGHQKCDSLNDIDVNYEFNNDEDFTKSSGFSFPNKPSSESIPVPHGVSSHSKSFSLDVSSPPRSYSSPKRILTSPIRLQKKKSSALNTPKNKFFLTEETTLNDDNIPDAVIDLDDVLNANLHIGNGIPRKDHEFFSYDDDFLSSPFTKASSPRFSPMSLPYQTLLQQPIRETNDDIDEDPEYDDTSDSKLLHFDEAPEPAAGSFTPPNLNEIYSNSSANSSTSSLKSNLRHKLIEKTHSNSSKDSNNSGLNQSTPASSKRSGAQANRYRSIYDHSYKVSSALKVNSSESINIIKPVKPIQKDPKTLGHSSSLPSLKSRHNPKYIPRFPDNRYNKLSPPPSIGLNNHLNNSPSSLNNGNVNTIPKHSNVSNVNTPVQSASIISNSTSNGSSPNRLKVGSPSKPATSNSPVSVASDLESTIISATGTLQSTDHSSMASHEFKPEQCMPSIIINNEEVKTPTNSAYSTELDTVHNTPTIVSDDRFTTPVSSTDRLASNASSAKTSPRKEARRPLTPNEQMILQQTQIPPYRKSPIKHTKAKSMSIMSELAPRLSKTSQFDDTVSVKSARRARFFGWFKKTK